jgi:hypothetical protein
VAGLAGLKLGLHLFVNAITPYGFHRDELLYLAMGRRAQGRGRGSTDGGRLREGPAQRTSNPA